MLFNSYIFLFLFFPLVLLGYYLLGKLPKLLAANLFLIGMSLWFYGYFNPAYLLIICGSVAGNYALSRLILKNRARRAGKLVLLFGILANVGLIFYYKYCDFFLENVNALFRVSFTLRHMVLPLGISFFTFQQISYLVDSYRGETESYRFDEYALFVCYFPQLIAGPIVLHSELIPQLRDPARSRFCAARFAHGMYLFATGLFKKVLVADTLSRAVLWGYDTVSTLGMLEAWIVSLSYCFQIYFDFSGYCDMALGIGHMMNLSLPQNFNSPYKALSVPEFWERWHMSLTRFLRCYVYFPLGGSRRGRARTYLNIMLVFLVSGLWHGANWTFVVWGLLHGAFNCLTRACRKDYEKLNPVTRWMLTFVLTNILWVIFRADNLATAWEFILHMFLSPELSVRGELAACFVLPEFSLLLERIPQNVHWYLSNYKIWLVLLGALFAVLNGKNSGEREIRPSAARGAVTVLLLFWSIISLSGVSEFLYFDF